MPPPMLNRVKWNDRGSMQKQNNLRRIAKFPLLLLFKYGTLDVPRVANACLDNSDQL